MAEKNKNQKEEMIDETAEKNSREAVNESEKKTGIEDEVSVDEGEAKRKKKDKKDKKELKIAELEEKLAELTDRHLRLQAEFDNFRKRTIRERAELIKFGGESVILDILPVIDDFERAIQSLELLPEDDPGKQGTVLIYSKLIKLLKQHQVEEIEALNQFFCVDLHEAVTQIPAPEEELKGKVVEVIQKGYTLNGKVIRYAKVVVGA